MERLTRRRADTGEPCICTIEGLNKAVERLAAYEDTGLEPEEVEVMREIFLPSLHSDLAERDGKEVEPITSFEGIPIERAIELARAEKDGRLVVLPCKVGDTVYTIKESYFDCDACEHKAEARYQQDIQRVSCKLEGVHCPLKIQEHIVKGFEVSGKDGEPVLSSPGEWGYEGLEYFMGRDGKWYLTRQEAEEALRKEAENG